MDFRDEILWIDGLWVMDEFITVESDPDHISEAILVLIIKVILGLDCIRKKVGNTEHLHYLKHSAA